MDDYCYENKLDSCFTLDIIKHDKIVRKLFESMIDELLEKYKLISQKVIVREKTIFDDQIMEKLHIAEDTNCNETRNIFDKLAVIIKNNMQKQITYYYH